MALKRIRFLLNKMPAPGEVKRVLIASGKLSCWRLLAARNSNPDRQIVFQNLKLGSKMTRLRRKTK